MPRYSLVVLSNPVAGREAEYNDWYTGRHLADVLRVPGIVAAQRFGVVPEQLAPDAPRYAYMAVYECETDDIGTVVAALKVRTGTPEMPMSDAFGPDPYVCIYEPITGRMSPA